MLCRLPLAFVLTFGLLFIADAPCAKAAIVLATATTGPGFAFGPANSLTTFSSVGNLNNFAVGGGVTVTADPGFLFSATSPVGLRAAGTGNLTFNFASGVTGFGFQTDLGTFNRTITTSFGGTSETNSVGTFIAPGNNFRGFVSDTNTPFTSVTMNFAGGLSFRMTDFRTITAVPEPGTLATSGLVALVVSARALMRRKKRAALAEPSENNT